LVWFGVGGGSFQALDGFFGLCGFGAVGENFDVVFVFDEGLVEAIQLLEANCEFVGRDSVVFFVDERLAIPALGAAIVLAFKVVVALFDVLGGLVGIEGVNLHGTAVGGRTFVGQGCAALRMFFGVIGRRTDVDLSIFAGALTGIVGQRGRVDVVG